MLTSRLTGASYINESGQFDRSNAAGSVHVESGRAGTARRPRRIARLGLQVKVARVRARKRDAIVVHGRQRPARDRERVCALAVDARRYLGGSNHFGTDNGESNLV